MDILTHSLPVVALDVGPDLVSGPSSLYFGQNGSQLVPLKTGSFIEVDR